MKIKFQKRELEKHLEKVSRAIQSNSALPSLQGLLMNITESNIQLIGSNANLSIKEIIEPSEKAKVIEPGKALIPGSLFRNIIKKQDNEITLTTTDKSIIIESNGAQTSLQLLNSHDYPVISFETIGKDLIIDSSSLEGVIKNVSFAAAENDKRMILNGVNLKSKNGILTAIATNSFRLAKEEVEVDSNSEFDITILSKNLKDFVPKDISGPITISVNDSKIVTKHENTTVMSKLIDGVYPNTDGLIPVQFSKILKIDSKELYELVDKATVVANDANKVVRLTINESKLTVESKRREVGDSIVETNNHEWKGEEIIIALNSQFLKESIAKYSKSVVVAFNGSHDPIVIKGESNPKLTQLILPHRSY